MLNKISISILSLGALLVGALYINVTQASHSWGNYHWMRSANTVELQVGDNVSSQWDSHLDTAIGDWNAALAVKLTKVISLSNPKKCRPVAGRIEACSSRYGNNGWLGLAQIWISNGHITQAVTKLNDTYFDTAKYNQPAWRNLVTCQELAHDFGLDHQDENFDNPNLGTCMDYTSNPDGPPSNEHPNAHDYEQIEIIYSHLDAATSSLPEKSGKNGNLTDDEEDFSDPKSWGRETRKDSRGRPSKFERNLGGGKKVITHVIWVDSIEGK